MHQLYEYVCQDRNCGTSVTAHHKPGRCPGCRADKLRMAPHHHPFRAMLRDNTEVSKEQRTVSQENQLYWSGLSERYRRAIGKPVRQKGKDPAKHNSKGKR